MVDFYGDSDDDSWLRMMVMDPQKNAAGESSLSFLRFSHFDRSGHH